jgi:two-component system chemotaxis sensor kinase CheA
VSGPTPAELFLQEAQELLEQLEHSLLDLAANPGNTELIDASFRALHTIKGSGAMFGFEAVAAFTHHFETVFDRVRQGKLAADEPMIRLALAARDHIRHMIESPGPDDAALAAPILAGLQALLGDGSAAQAPDQAEAAGAAPSNGFRLRIRLPRDAMQMGTNPLLLLDELRGLGTASITADASGVPKLEDLDPTACHIGWTVELHTTQPRTAIEDVFLFVIDEMELQIDALAAAAMPPAPADVIEPGLATSADTAAAPPQAAEAARPEAHNRRLADSVRVPAERLDDLMDRVGELVIAQSRLSQVAAASTDAQVKSIAEDIQRLALELRDSTMGVRTVPIGSLFGRFRRLVHDLSAQLGKDITLVTIGEETELDKTVIEKLNDPLIHLLRNSIDHGLETPQGRAAAGKPEAGRITLTARHAGAEVLICIADDGRGLDRARIRARAEENGLIAPGAIVPDAELLAVIFQPGFSTAREVTSLSGRGVGMDVVKQAIEALRGKIEIASVEGIGTELTLRLPLTLAIIDGLLVRVSTGRYVLPLSSVEECVELSAEQDARARGRNFLNIRGDLVPFLRLRELFGATTPADRFQKVVIVAAGKSRVGLVVDQVIGNHQTVIKSLCVLHATARMFSGATILGDGAVALILDVAQLVEYGQSRSDEFREAG